MPFPSCVRRCVATSLILMASCDPDSIPSEAADDPDPVLLASQSAEVQVYGPGDTTAGWDIYDADPAGASVSVVNDSIRGPVNQFISTGTSNGFRLRKADLTPWANTTNFNISWWMRFTGSFVVYIDVNTSVGRRYLYYTSSSRNDLNSTPGYIHHGLGPSARDGAWHRFQRDLKADLQEAQPSLTLLSVNAFLIRGSGLVDDVTLSLRGPVQVYGPGDSLAGWDIYDADPAGAVMSVVDDQVRGKVNKFTSTGTDNGFRLRRLDGTPWANTTHSYVSWWMRFAVPVVIYIDVNTSAGQRYISYTDSATSALASSPGYIHHALGTGASDGEWHWFQRDLAADLREADPSLVLLSVNAFLVHGSGLIDDVALSNAFGLSPPGPVQVYGVGDSTVGWDIYDNTPAGAQVAVVADPIRGRVNQVRGAGIDNGFRLRKPDLLPWDNTSSFNIAWAMRFSGRFVVYVDVATSGGQRYLNYTPDDRSNLASIPGYIHHGLGASAADGAWHVFGRDLKADLREADPSLTLLAVNAFLVRGSGLIDDVSLQGSAFYGLDARPANAACHAFAAPPASGQLRLVDRFPNVAPITPTGLVQRPGDNTRWYVLERGGRILHFPNQPTAQANDVKVALDLRDVTYANIDCSLASLAFPPDFATSKRAYVGYCHITSDGLQIRVSRFTTSDGGATFDRASEELLVAIDYTPADYNNVHQPPGLHAADAMHFGPDGYLYVALGDGGPQGILGGQQAQNKNDLRGKLLRIDVSDPTKKLVDDGIVFDRQRVGAGIPADNPFVSLGERAAAVYAFGFRNPWQWHFDRTTHAIWLGDVGNNSWEEVNRNVQKGGNYGWGIYEGTHCTNLFPTGACDDPTLIPPLLDYAHGTGPQDGNAVTGGIVYRGSALPSLRGAYIFGDSARAKIWVVRNVDQLPTSTMPAKELLFSGVPVSAFAEDQDGEIFAVSLAGKILALEEVPADTTPTTGGPPPLLSQTGCFDPVSAMAPTPDLVPFAPSAELWSDGATKRRWMVIPDAKSITVNSDGDFDFPAGTVLVKEFSLAGTKVETRFLVRQQADGKWAGYSYRWNDAQTDATLVGADGDAATVGTQVWNFPSRAQCHQCHTSAAGNALGPEIAQLNHAITYPATGRTANQVATLEKVGLVNTTGVAKPWPALPSLTQDGYTVADRARAYLHVNCSNCHRPGGPTFTPPDFRFGVALSAMGICNVPPTISALEDFIPSDPRLLAPGVPSRSVLYVRLSTVDSGVRMPPIGRTLVHSAAASVVADWITQTTTCP